VSESAKIEKTNGKMLKSQTSKLKEASKVVLIRLGIYVFVNKARGGGSPKFFIDTL
jgi:hypothetical protein